MTSTSSSRRRRRRTARGEYSDQAAYMALNKNLVERLLDWRFITGCKVGSHHIISYHFIN
jgi:hypothetical protein